MRGGENTKGNGREGMEETEMEERGKKTGERWKANGRRGKGQRAEECERGWEERDREVRAG